MLLTLDDLPHGFDALPVGDGAARPTHLDTRLAPCVTTPVIATPDPTARAAFSRRDGIGIAALVTFTGSPAVARRPLELLRSNETLGCLERLFRRKATPPDRPGTQVGQLTIDRVEVPAVGDETTAYRVTLPFTAGGRHLAFHVEAVLVRVGRITILAQFSTEGEPFDLAEAARLTRIMADRAPPS